LSLSLLELKVIHSNFFFLLSDGLFTSLEDVFIDVRLFIQDTELIILIDKLNTLVVSGLAGHFVLKDKGVHLLLQ
jgi:hypothetical protein